jgi:hypothetical protein
MTTVRFEIHRVIGSDVEELDEDAIARIAGELVELDELEGAIVIEGDGQPRAAIVDDLSSAVQRLCFESVVALLVPGTTYGYRYFTATNQAELVSTPTAIALRGDDIPAAEHPRDALLSAFHACGLRYLALLDDLAGRGRDASTGELAHLRPFAERARDALRQQGLT